MAPEDILLLGTGVLVVLNRAFTSTGLKEVRPAYVVIQLVNAAACVALTFFFRLEGFPAHLDLSVRVFLMLVIVWHMVLNNQARTRALRRRVTEAQEEKARAERRAEAMAAIHAGAQNVEAAEDSEE